MIRKIARNKTLRKNVFMEGGKYKWSRKYDRCIICGSGESKHKSRGKCSRCTDKQRALNPKRKENLKKQSNNWYIREKKKLEITWTINKIKSKIHRRFYKLTSVKLNGYYAKWYGKQKFIRLEYKRLQNQFRNILNKGFTPMQFRYQKSIIMTPFSFDGGEVYQNNYLGDHGKKANNIVRYLPYSRDLKIWIHKTKGIPIKDIHLGMSECSNYIN